jgi:hypothetical protein
MKKFKLIRQQSFFKGGAIVDDSNRTYETIIEANSCDEFFKITIIESVELAKNFGYSVGDKIKTLLGIKFIKEDGEEEIIDLMLGDPYYKVLDENDNIIFKHECKHHH